LNSNFFRSHSPALYTLPALSRSGCSGKIENAKKDLLLLFRNKISVRLRTIVLRGELGDSKHKGDGDLVSTGHKRMGTREGIGSGFGGFVDDEDSKRPVRTVKVSQAVQVAINAHYLVVACTWFDTHVHRALEQHRPTRNINDVENGVPQREHSEADLDDYGGDIPEWGYPDNQGGLLSKHTHHGQMRLPKNGGKGVGNYRGRSKGSCFKARRLFRQTQSLCEDIIFKLINGKIKELMGLAKDIDWECHSSPRLSPHEYLFDLITYLDTTFQSLARLPIQIRENVPLAGFARISEYYFELLSNQKARFNIIGICNLSCDLRALEMFALSLSPRLPPEKATSIHAFYQPNSPTPLTAVSNTNAAGNPEADTRARLVHVLAFKSLRQVVNMLLVGCVPEALADTKPAISNEEDRSTAISEVKRLLSIWGNYKAMKEWNACQRLPSGVRNLKNSEVNAILRTLRARLRALGKISLSK